MKHDAFKDVDRDPNFDEARLIGRLIVGIFKACTMNDERIVEDVLIEQGFSTSEVSVYGDIAAVAMKELVLAGVVSLQPRTLQ